MFSRIAVALVPVAFVAGFAVAQTMTQTGREQLFENAEAKVGSRSCCRTIRCRCIGMSIRASSLR
jgi:hypothetical protein